ncbi:MAG: helix-turn-helix domain-containing protein [Roseinatronobacter sp.]
MSIDAVGWAFTVSDLKTSEKIALVGLANFADEFGVCYPRQDTLCEMCSLAIRTLRGALSELEKRGLIARIERRRADGSRRSDVYLLVGFEKRKAITDDVDHAVLDAHDIVLMTASCTTNRQNLPVGDPDLFPADQPADSARPTGKSCTTNRQILHDQPADFARPTGRICRYI